MKTETALKWAGIYLALWIFVTVVAVALVAAGVALDGLDVLGMSEYTPFRLRGGRSIPIAGVALIGLGGLIFQFGTAAAGFKVGVSAIESETASHFDAETMKSDILSVLDDRLADIHQEVSQTKRLVNRMGREEAAEEFEFQDDL